MPKFALLFIALAHWAITPLGASIASAQAPTFVEFESGLVRPLALSPDGKTLFAVNTPDNRLEIFDVNGDGIFYRSSVLVGLEPVAVAARNDSEVWVVNHLSDSISIVNVASETASVTRTILVGDEPRDIVFAGPGGNRAFITCARRGQNHTGFAISELTTASLGRADVFVFDANNLGASLQGTPLTVVTLFGDIPRALAANADGSRVYAAVFHSGNQTTTISEGVVCNGGAGAGPCNTADGQSVPGGLPAPNGTAAGTIGGKAAPETGLIVKFDNASGQWRDHLNRNWSNGVRFNLPDRDVFAIDANANPPVLVANYQRVGTTLFNMIVNPQSGKLYVSNTDANNAVRFEGPANPFSTVRGNLAKSRISIIDATGAGTVTTRHLNKHINYSAAPQPVGTKANSLAIPNSMAITPDGNTLYVAAFGSSKVGIYNTSSLEDDSFTPSAANHVSLSGGGAGGLALDTNNNRLYVLTRFNNSVATVDLNNQVEVSSVSLHNPEPTVVVEGREFLYNADHTSSNGEASCASCHIFGDMDQLAWDLGNPSDELLNIPFSVTQIRLGLVAQISGASADLNDFHPLKGPMTTQTLRGMVNAGAMHWRGDRTGGNDAGGSPFDSNAAFLKFNGAFPGLIGRDEGELPATEMQKFANFILSVTLPPNPIRNLNNSLNTAQQNGSNFFFGTRRSDGVTIDIGAQNGFTCNGCHVTNPANGHFGTDGVMSFENETQLMKIAHLRNVYQKVGMFGMPRIGFFNAGDNGHKGDQIRGFGFLHDGSTDTVFRFLNATVFNNANGVGFNGGDPQRRDMEQFMLAFPTDLAPIVGQQTTLTSTNGATVGPRITLLIQRAQTPFVWVEHPNARECDLVVSGVISGAEKGWKFDAAANNFVSATGSEAPIADAALRALVASASDQLTYSCVPPGSGDRIGRDRDEDTVPDTDDNCPQTANAAQADADVDGVGDACDLLAGFTGLATVELHGEEGQGEPSDPTPYDAPSDTVHMPIMLNTGGTGVYVMRFEVTTAGQGPLIARGSYLLAGDKLPIEDMPGFVSLNIEGNVNGPYQAVLTTDGTVNGAYLVEIEAADQQGNKDTIQASFTIFTLVISAITPLEIVGLLALALLVFGAKRRRRLQS